MKGLKQRLLNETLIGCWLNLGSSVSAEIVGLAGFDWVLIDFEHGSGTEKDVLHQLQALEHTKAAAIIRVESYERQRIHRMLDYGANGIMIPRIESIEDAERGAKAMRYQPEGVRGVARMVRAAQYGLTFDDYMETSHKDIVGIVQIETRESLDLLDDIAAIDGIDVLFIGPMDLSTALGVRGQWDHPDYIRAIEQTARAAEKAGKTAGILLPVPGELLRYTELGYRFIASGSDTGFVAQGAINTIKNITNKIKA